MAKVRFGLSRHDLGREEKAVVFDAATVGKLGELHVSRGGLRWYPKNSQTSHHFLNWKRFGEIMEKHVKRVK